MNDLNVGLLSGHSCKVSDAEVECHFRNIEEVLLKELSQSHIVLGCVAWITSHTVLKSLSERPCCLILDGKTPKMNKPLTGLYAALEEAPKEKIYHFLKQGKGWEDYFCYSDAEGNPKSDQIYRDWNFESGLYAVDGYRFMHHKFLLLIKEDGSCTNCGRTKYLPTVWTGSYNLTKNARKGLENAVIIRNKTVAASYLCEFLEVFQNHSRQQNITTIDAMKKGWRDQDIGGYASLCERGNYFPMNWFGSCCSQLLWRKGPHYQFT